MPTNKIKEMKETKSKTPNIIPTIVFSPPLSKIDENV